MDIREYIKEELLFLDGGMGTLLQARGLFAGELPERWNITHPEVIADIHRAYFDAGANVVNTNTFGANSLKFAEDELDNIICRAVENARTAKGSSRGTQPKWIALDIGPTGRMIEPLGDLSFEDAVEIFAKTVRLGVKHGADLIFIETMADSYETKAALLAAKENSTLPVFVSNAYSEDGKLMTGASPEAMVCMLEGMGADAVGVNCSLGPAAMGDVVRRYLASASVPVIMKANAGLPRCECGCTVYDVDAAEFAREESALVREGVCCVGGCCGTTPEYIEALVASCRDIKKLPAEEKNITAVSSYTHAVSFGKAPVLIGERINPTGKARFKEALRAGDLDYILREGICQSERGVHVLDVNVGLAEIDEVKMLTDAVRGLQSVTDTPLQIDTSNTAAMEAALRIYNGKAMINSVNGKEESMRAVFPLAKKYGGVVVALTLDEGGIPEKAEGRVEIAKKILLRAREYGIDKKDIIFDPLALTVSADNNAAVETLRAVERITRELGCICSLGVSNVSFGLPERDTVNSAFFALALGKGLGAAILNPYSDDMMRTYHAYKVLAGLDGNCAEYIEYAQKKSQSDSKPAAKSAAESIDTLYECVVRGMRDRAAACAAELLKDKPALEIIEGELIPALDFVGVGFEKKQVYLPSLLMSAEAASAAFEVIRASMKGETGEKKYPIVLATVKGDIHDIGKNIVKLLLDNYGFEVHDLGRDVPPEKVADEVKRLGAPLLGLSALMTTTVGAMEDTVKLVRATSPKCRIMVGGAVLTEEYARMIGADKYASDAMEGVRYAESLV